MVWSYVVTALAAVLLPYSIRKFSYVEKYSSTISSLNITQILTSWAITITGIHKYLIWFEDDHGVLAFDLAILAGISQAVPLWSGIFETTDITLTFRQALNLLQSILHFIWCFLKLRVNDTSTATLAQLLVGSIMNLVVNGGWFCITATAQYRAFRGKGQEQNKTDRDSQLTQWTKGALFGNSIATLYNVVQVLRVKYDSGWCSLTSAADEAWTFGQWLTIIMTIAPFISLIEESMGTFDVACATIQC